MQSALEHGHLRFSLAKTIDLRHEAVALQWDDTRTKHSERCADDCFDALLMGALPHFGEAEPEAMPAHGPRPGSAEARAKQEAEELEEAFREAMREIDDEAA